MTTHNDFPTDGAADTSRIGTEPAGETRLLTVEQTTSTAHRLYHYDGACNNIHGHNFRWKIEAAIDMRDADGDTGMVVDLKDLKDVVDAVDHAVILNAEDPLADTLSEEGQTVYTLPEDPTCENVVAWMIECFVEELPITGITLTLEETDKYGVTATYYPEEDHEGPVSEAHKMNLMR